MAKPHLYRKIQKLAKCGGGHLLSQPLRRLRQENRLNLGDRGCSESRLWRFTPAWETEQDSVSKTKKELKKKFKYNDVTNTLSGHIRLGSYIQADIRM